MHPHRFLLDSILVFWRSEQVQNFFCSAPENTRATTYLPASPDYWSFIVLWPWLRWAHVRSHWYVLQRRRNFASVCLSRSYALCSLFGVNKSKCFMPNFVLVSYIKLKWDSVLTKIVNDRNVGRIFLWIILGDGWCNSIFSSTLNLTRSISSRIQSTSLGHTTEHDTENTQNSKRPLWHATQRKSNASVTLRLS